MQDRKRYQAPIRQTRYGNRPSPQRPLSSIPHAMPSKTQATVHIQEVKKSTAILTPKYRSIDGLNGQMPVHKSTLANKKSARSNHQAPINTRKVHQQNSSKVHPNTRPIRLQANTIATTLSPASTQAKTKSSHTKPVANSKNTNLKLLYTVSAFCFLMTVFFAGSTLLLYKKTRDNTEVLAASSDSSSWDTEEGDGDNPTETKPDERALSSYKTDPDKPRFIRIPSKSVNARIKELGTTKTGNIDAPWNIHDVGWYNGTIKPGSKNGVSLLLGHASGRSSPGVFGAIKEMSVGDTVEVELGDGTNLSYKVDKIEEYQADSIDLSSILYSVPKGEQSLRLITCSGSFNSTNRQFESRTVVYTSPVQTMPLSN